MVGKYNSNRCRILKPCYKITVFLPRGNFDTNISLYDFTTVSGTEGWLVASLNTAAAGLNYARYISGQSRYSTSKSPLILSPDSRCKQGFHFDELKSNLGEVNYHWLVLFQRYLRGSLSSHHFTTCPGTLVRYHRISVPLRHIMNSSNLVLIFNGHICIDSPRRVLLFLLRVYSHMFQARQRLHF